MFLEGTIIRNLYFLIAILVFAKARDRQYCPDFFLVTEKKRKLERKNHICHLWKLCHNKSIQLGSQVFERL
jgi:hypothetical protein